MRTPLLFLGALASVVGGLGGVGVIGGAQSRTTAPVVKTAQPPAFTRAYPLAPTEGVFAYSRISPDGNYLAYASMTYDTTRPRPQSQENLYGPAGTVTNPGTVT